MSSLETIIIPASVTSIGDEFLRSFDSIPSITVAKDSFAEAYCIKNKLPFKPHNTIRNPE